MTDALSYEDLYELLRAERASADLEKLYEPDLNRIATYLKAKEEILNQQDASASFASTKNRAKILLEIENAMQIIKDIFERREQKVINRAIFSVRSDSNLKDTTNMLEHEEKLYNRLLDLFEENKKTFFKLIEEQKAKIVLEPVKEEFKSAAEIASEEDDAEEETEQPEEEISESKAEPEAAEEVEETPAEELTEAENITEKSSEEKPADETAFKKVKFLTDVPEFVDENLKTCGPYKAGDEAELSPRIAELLLKHKKIEEVN